MSKYISQYSAQPSNVLATDQALIQRGSTYYSMLMSALKAYTSPDADGSTKGLVQLAGALGGTAAVPTALGLADQAALAEYIYDTVAAIIVQSTNMTVTLNDTNNTITLASSGGGGGLTFTVKEAGVSVSTSIGTLDFGAGFDVTESPAGEANVSLDLAEMVLTGLSTASAADVSAADSVLSAIGKFQAKWNAFTASVLAVALTGIDVATQGAVSAADSILAAIGKLQATKVDTLAPVATTNTVALVRGTHGNRIILATPTADTNYTIEDDTTGAWQAGDTLPLIINLSAFTITLVGDGTSTLGVPRGFTDKIRGGGIGGAARTAANTWKSTTQKAHAEPFLALADAATIAVDASLGSNRSLTLVTTGRTMGAPTNPESGQILNFNIDQDGTGGRTLAWNAAYLFPGGTDPVIPTAANAKFSVSCQYDGTSWRCNFPSAAYA